MYLSKIVYIFIVAIKVDVMLTEEQSGTIEVVAENKMIVALAGSGKTHTFISLVERILKENPLNDIAMVTFTNAATSEMEERVKKKVGSMSSRVNVGTFARLMRRQFLPLINKRKLLIGGEYYSFIKRAMISEGVDLDDLNDCLPEIDKLGRELDFTNNDSPFSRVFVAYVNLLKRYARYDLNMMGRELISALVQKKIKPIKETHILCDEFQDTDSLQYAWLKENCRDKVVAVVGDDDQAIYGWRGGLGYQAFVDFQEDFNAEAYLLSQCFRCAPEVLDVAKSFIEHNVERIDKDMSSPKNAGGSVTLKEIPHGYISNFTKEESERDSIDLGNTAVKENLKLEPYRYVAQELVGKEGGGWAVLARTNLQLDELEKAMAELEINVVRIGGKSIFDNEHAFGISALIIGVVSPKGISQLPTGLGWLGEKEDVLHQIFISSKGMGFSAVSTSAGTNWKGITIAMQELAIDAQRVDKNIQNIHQFLKAFESKLKKHITDQKDSSQQFQQTILDIFIRILMNGKGSLEDRVFKLAAKIKNPSNKPSHKQSNAVLLTTLNSSKGLEWPNVWIVDMDQGKIPLLRGDDGQDKLEEERRLVYVGITRAEDNLVISYNEKTPSSFIEEIRGW